jgi:hypothetical protein
MEKSGVIRCQDAAAPEAAALFLPWAMAALQVLQTLIFASPDSSS